MKELDRFTSQRLESLCDYRPNRVTNLINFREIAALARIALAAKSAEPVAYWNDACDLDDGAFSYANDAGCTRPLYDTPQLNSPEIPEGWKLVPNMPTLGMLSVLGLTGSFESMLGRYADMLAAAPESE